MAKTALLFTGQGGQSLEMFSGIPDTERTRYVLDAAESVYGYSFRTKTSELSPDELSNTFYAQPLTLVYELAMFQEYFGNGKHEFSIIEELDSGRRDFDAVGGHSLGEYAALYAMGAIGLEEVLQLVKLRAEYMSQCASVNEFAGNKGVMSAVILKPQKYSELFALTAEKDVKLHIANYNSPEQFVLSGSENEVAADEEILNGAEYKPFVKRVVRLNTGGAFHTSYMADAAERFAEKASAFKFMSAEKYFYSNLYGKKVDFKPEGAGAYLSKHIMRPVMFTDQISAMYNDGIREFVEIGPKETLTAFVKKIVSDENVKVEYFKAAQST
jgi:[acyl-carrier-protein] S-malonyltransferase